MKNITKTSILTLLVVLLCACKGGNNSSEKYTLEYNLEKGATLNQNMVMESNTTLNAFGQEMKTVINMTAKMSYDVIDIQDDNIYTMNMKYDEIKMDMDMANVKMSFDSNTTEEKATLENLSPIFKSMIGILIEMTIDKHGEVQSISGLDDITNAMRASMSDFDEEMQSAMFQQFEGQFSYNALKTAFEQSTTYLPKEPVAVGDEWNSTADMQVGNINIKTDAKIKLKSVNENIATLEVKGTVETPKEGIVQEVSGMTSKITMKGTQNATVKIDLTNGWTVNAEITQNFDGENEMMGMKIPMTIENRIVITD